MTQIAKKPKAKRCSNPACGQSFTPQRIGQAVCGYACGLAIKDVNIEKANKAMKIQDRNDTKVRREKLKSKGDYLREAQKVFNAWVRERDRGLPCISCGVNYPDSEVNVWDAGHMRSVGASSSTRFNAFNVNKQCVRCNRYLSSNAINYRIGLAKKIGEERVDRLYSAPPIASYTKEYLIRLKNVFKRRIIILRSVRAKSGLDNGTRNSA